MSEIKARKQRHIRISLEKNVEGEIPTGFEDITLIHRCIPEINLDDVDIRQTIFNKELRAPIIISAITGGTAEAGKINATLASVADRLGLGIGLGSQRIGIQNPQTSKTFSTVRKHAPEALVIANIGCPQLSLGWGLKEARTAVEMVEADALAIHMNPLQEVVQVNGDTHYSGVVEKVAEITEELSVPVIMKETGAGISYEDALNLLKIGVKGFEISGVGGTSWAAVEHHIAKEVNNPEMEYLGKAYWNWGLPTAVSLVEVAHACGRFDVEKSNVNGHPAIIASGGIRTGIEAAKSIALGADASGIAKPLLEKAVIGKEILEKYIRLLITELKASLFLTGSRNLRDLSNSPLVVNGWSAEWLINRGFDSSFFAIKGRKNFN